MASVTSFPSPTSSSRHHHRLNRIRQHLAGAVSTSALPANAPRAGCGIAGAACSSTAQDATPQVAPQYANTQNDLQLDDVQSMYSSGQRPLFSSKFTQDVELQELKGVSISTIREYKICHLKDFCKVEDVDNFFIRTKFPRNYTDRLHSVCYVNDKEREVILADIARRKSSHMARSFIRAGQRRRIVWRQGEVRAAIVTCGGLCPGLNDVIAEITKTLFYNYGVDTVFGIQNGYKGFYEYPWLELTPQTVEHIHLNGGTRLGASRGGFDLERILESLHHHGVNQLYIIGGDGTHRGAAKICKALIERKAKVTVVAIPKTIDNDMAVIDRSFGFDTAVEEAQKAIVSAKVEAECTPNGVGIVKLMGRKCGMIAAHATIASREVDLCLIPEVPFVLDGPFGILEHIEMIVRHKGHAVIVVAEGAGADLLKPTGRVDASGNPKLPPIDKFIRNHLREHFAKRKLDISLKYHDPSYMIRSVPSNASDSVYCMTLSQNAVHGAMAGFTGFTSAVVNNRSVMLPIWLITETSPIGVNPMGRTWKRVVHSTHQPDFVPKEQPTVESSC